MSEAPTCKQILRDNVPCPEPQRGLIHWPGRDPLPCCARHIKWAEFVADALGFKLQVTITHPADGDDVAQRFSMLEIE